MELIGQLIYCKDIGRDGVFWRELLGLNNCRRLELDSRLRIDILAADERREVIALTDYSACVDYENVLIFSSNDCIEDVHVLKKAGARSLGRFQYSKAGLSARVTDEAGNLLILIEERDYGPDDD